jgi:hypothetical protein
LSGKNIENHWNEAAMKIKKSIPSPDRGFTVQESRLDESRCFEGVIALPMEDMQAGTEYLVNIDARRIITKAMPPRCDALPDAKTNKALQPLCSFNHYLLGKPFVIHELIGAVGPLGYLCITGGNVELDPSADSLGHIEAGLKIFFDPGAESMTFLGTQRYEDLLHREVLSDDLVSNVRKGVSILKTHFRDGSIKELVKFAPPALTSRPSVQR